MKKKSHISFGPGAASLILIFVVLTLSVLGMLSLMNARNDRVLSERNAAVTESIYVLNARAENTRAALDEVLYVLAGGAQNDDEYLSALQLLLSVGMDEDDDFTAFTAMLTGARERAGDRDEKELATDALLSLTKSSEGYAAYRQKLTLLGSMTLEGDVLSWQETDGLRTLDCALRILPLGSEMRSEWVRYDLTAKTAEAW